MLFQKNIEPRCTYCQRGTPLDEEKILCTKQGCLLYTSDAADEL